MAQSIVPSDENAIMEQVKATHEPDDRKLAVKPLLYIIQDIFQPSTPRAPRFGLGTQVHLDVLDDKALQFNFLDMLDVLSSTINNISLKFSGGEDEHATTLEILNILKSYEWDAKVVLALAAFGFNYGEFLVVAQPYSTNPLVKSVPLIKQFPETQEPVDTFTPKFEAVSNLIKSTLNVIKCIVELTDFASKNISNEKPETMVAATSQIPEAVYWTIRSILACASQILGLTGMGYEKISSTAEALKLSSLVQKVSSILNDLKMQLPQLIGEQRYAEAYRRLRRLMEREYTDNMEILRALIYAKEDQLPLLDGATKKRASIEVLKRKNVLLLISDLEVSYEELSILEQIYKESHQDPTRTESQYEMSVMPWYSVYHPSMIDPAVIMYIQEVWHFKKKPIVVVLDPRGKVVNHNAVHMLWIWGTVAFPFTSDREASLWELETWRLELLVDGIDPVVLNWISEGKNICLYGGSDIEWIRKFTTAALAVTRAAKIPLEILYVGKSNPKEKNRRNISIITGERLSHVWPDLTSVWFFWKRLESMCSSKTKLGCRVENDPIMQEIDTMLRFDRSGEGWALFCKGTAIARADGETIGQCLIDFDSWKTYLKDTDFVTALNHHLNQLQKPTSMRQTDHV
ncbi:hypothetical protein Pint_28818 [Pistacia integerrima]|uniref:Uncharacterized protein n=2 Tax=Pistacia integerrima TaxID=434235 RepID=A0ACC0X073_9ROSI|nr:hypothetical protein Pint_28818 [Pistacia integerrima]